MSLVTCDNVETMPRRRRRKWGSGTITKRGGRWTIQWREDGRRHFQSFVTRSIAEMMLKRVTAQAVLNKVGEAGDAARRRLLNSVSLCEAVPRIPEAMEAAALAAASSLPWTDEMRERFRAELLTASHPRGIFTGIYVLFLAGRIVYVGQSTNVFARLAQHQERKTFDRFSFIVCTRTDLNNLETKLIREFRPPLNISKNSTPAPRQRDAPSDAEWQERLKEFNRVFPPGTFDLTSPAPES